DVTFPLISTALVAGALLAFALSFDEVIVTTFTAGAQNTLPLWIFGAIRLGQRLPEVNVVVFFVILITIVPVVIASRLTGGLAGRWGIPVSAVRERRADITRRQFLKGGVAGAAGLALAGPWNITRSAYAASPRIGIIGAGISGLTAAITLQDAGISSMVYESSSRIGGRMHSDTSNWAGQTSEWCGELIDQGHKTILHLAQRFGLATVNLLAGEPNGSE